MVLLSADKRCYLRCTVKELMLFVEKVVLTFRSIKALADFTPQRNPFKYTGLGRRKLNIL